MWTWKSEYNEAFLSKSQIAYVYQSIADARSGVTRLDRFKEALLSVCIVLNKNDISDTSLMYDLIKARQRNLTVRVLLESSAIGKHAINVAILVLSGICVKATESVNLMKTVILDSRECGYFGRACSCEVLHNFHEEWTKSPLVGVLKNGYVGYKIEQLRLFPTLDIIHK